MKKILNFSLFSMLLALSLTAGNTTVSAKCASEEVEYTCDQEWHVEGMENASEDMEVSKENDSEEVEVLATPVATEVPEEVVAEEDEAATVKAEEVIVVPATEAPATEESQEDNGVVQEGLVEANATALEATVEEVQEEVAETPSEEIIAEDDIIVGVPPVIAEESAEEEEVVVEDEEVVTVEEDEIANSGVKKETVQENTKKSQNVQTAVKNVTNNDSTTAVLPQTGVLSDNIFYILGSMICALGVLSLAVAKRRAIR